LDNATILGLVASPAAGLPLEGGLGLVQDQLDPPVDLTGLDLELAGKVRDSLAMSSRKGARGGKWCARERGPP
jgi:hypothetical protein